MVVVPPDSSDPGLHRAAVAYFRAAGPSNLLADVAQCGELHRLMVSDMALGCVPGWEALAAVTHWHCPEARVLLAHLFQSGIIP